MKGRVWVQRGKRECGWISLRNIGLPMPKSIDDVSITTDINYSIAFDVDNPDGFNLINDFISKGFTVCIASHIIHRTVASPSESPFTTVV